MSYGVCDCITCCKPNYCKNWLDGWRECNNESCQYFKSTNLRCGNKRVSDWLINQPSKNLFVVSGFGLFTSTKIIKDEFNDIAYFGEVRPK